MMAQETEKSIQKHQAWQDLNQVHVSIGRMVIFKFLTFLLQKNSRNSKIASVLDDKLLYKCNRKNLV